MLSSTDRERNYVQAKFPDRPREFCFGLKYLSPKQLKRIRKKQRRRRNEDD